MKTNWALVLTHGCLDYTRLCVGDLLGQDVPMSILLIVNKPPEPDETPAWAQEVSLSLRQDPRGRKLIPLVMPVNLGCGPGWNLGLRIIFALGELQALVCGNDSRLRPDTYSKLSVEPGGAVFTSWAPSLEAMERGEASSPHAGAPSWDGIPDVGPVHMMRKWYFELVGGYDEKFWPIYWEDVDFYHRADLLGLGKDSHTMVELPSFHSDGGSRTIKRTQETFDGNHPRFVRLRERYIAKWGGTPPNEKYLVPFNGGPDPDAGPVNQ